MEDTEKAMVDGALLKKARSKMGLSQAAIGRRLNTNPVYYARLEQGETNCKVSLAYKLACVFDCSIEDLLCIVEE